nr:hypothetical protein [uncultured Blautia sp.]
MNRSKYIAVAAAAAMALTMAGCGFSGDEVVEVTPTPMATPTPTVISITATPLPTSTPAPKMIGKKTAQAKFIYLTNNLQNDIRELYLRISGDDEGDWGNNLLSAETAFKASEQVQMYYNGSSSDVSGQTDSENSTETSESSLKYDMKLVTADGSSYEIYSVDFGDMEKATLLLDQDSSSVYLRYMSLSTKKEADTRGNSVESSDENSDDSSTSSDDTSSDSSASGYDTSSDSSDSSYDTSSDDGSYDSSNDGNYDDSSDDGSYDDGSDDGSYDDGSYDDGYVDEGSDSGDYDTDESSSSDWDY